MPRKNVIYERVRINQRLQQANETVDTVITALYASAAAMVHFMTS